MGASSTNADAINQKFPDLNGTCAMPESPVPQGNATAVIPYQALLVVSFGGPEGPDDVIPFLENVLRGRNVPRERMLEVAEHYLHFGGISPINQQNREFIAAVRADFQKHGIDLPIYFGNRNWHPRLTDTIAQMKTDGIQRAVAFFTSAFSSYSGCRQYRENLIDACAQTGPGAPHIDRLRLCFNHPAFIEAATDRAADAYAGLSRSPQTAPLIFTAHSLPLSMARCCQYELQLRESCRLVADQLRTRGIDVPEWHLVYQSRSGPPQQPWLEPDVCDFVKSLHAESDPPSIVVMPIGFLSDHMEVLFDLDTELAELCESLGIELARAKTVGTHPAMVRLVRELILERVGAMPRQVLGNLPANPDVCADDCCLPRC